MSEGAADNVVQEAASVEADSGGHRQVAPSRWRAFLAKAVALVAVFWLLGAFAPSMPPLLLAVIWAVLSLASAIAASYHIMIGKERNRYGLKGGGALARLNAGRILSFTVAFVLSAMCLGGLILDLPKWSPAEWLMCVAAVPLFYGAYQAMGRLVSGEYEPLLQVSRTVAASSAVLCVLLIAAYAICCFAMPPEPYSSASEAFLKAGHPFGSSPSVLLSNAGYLASLVDGLTAFAMGKAAEGSFNAYVVWRVVLCAATALSISSLVGACALTADELKLLFLPLGSSEARSDSVQVLKRYVALACVLPVALVAGAVALDARVSSVANTREYTAVKELIRDQAGMAACVIDGKPYDYEKVHRLFDEMRGRSGALASECREGLSRLVNEAYDSRIANVDSYLDWYYSLPADYERLARYFAGTLEEGLREQMAESLSRGIDDSVLEEQIARYTEESDRLKAELEARLPECSLDDYGVDGIEWLTVDREEFGPDFFEIPLSPTVELTGSLQRAGLSAAVGAASGVVAARVVGRLSERAVFKKMLAKLSEKLAGRGLLAATGTALAPGIGTILGIGVGTVADFFLLKGEEALSRGEYKSEIIADLQEDRADVLAAIAATSSE